MSQYNLHEYVEEHQDAIIERMYEEENKTLDNMIEETLAINPELLIQVVQSFSKANRQRLYRIMEDEAREMLMGMAEARCED